MSIARASAPRLVELCNRAKWLLQQVPRRYSKRTGNPVNVDKADVPPSPLDTAQVGTVQLSCERKLLLRKTASLPLPPHCCPEPFEDPLGLHASSVTGSD